MATKTKTRRDIYQDITNKIVAQLEDGIRPWLKPRNAEHAAGRIKPHDQTADEDCQAFESLFPPLVPGDSDNRFA